MRNQPWNYFLSIEKDFVRTIDYVQLDTRNNNSFSNEFAKLLLLIGSEVDVVAKMLCEQIDPSAKRKDICDYRSVICNKFAGMHEIEIDIAKYSRKIKPWLNWDPQIASSPDWWKSYNKVKHERDTNFSEANQMNTLNALCGLLALLLYYLKNEDHLQPYPQLLLRIPGTSGHRFRFYPATDSDLIRPGIPGHPAT